MRRVSATEFARNLAHLLDEVEFRRESFEVVRKGRTVARVVPTVPPNGSMSKRALKRFKPGSEWAQEIAAVRSLLVDRDPWRD